VGLLMRLLFVAGVSMIAGQSTLAEQAMKHVGKAYLFDYGDLVVSVRYLSERKLAWEQVKGPEAGRKAEEDYGYTAIRPDVYFIWWQENDTSVVTQVVDFEKGRVFTTWISPEKKVESFQGMVRSSGPSK
jgi:hypothetical protein